MREYTVDWFSGNIPIFKGLLEKHLKLPRRKYLEIGSFEGLSTNYLLDNFLIGEEDSIYCVDTWEGGQEHDMDMGEVERRFRTNIADHSQKVKIYKGNSYDKLLELNREHRDSFDFIYIDGSHDSWDVLSDLVLAWPLLKIGGIMGCDDYLWGGPMDINNRQEDDRRPQAAIDTFLFTHRRFYELLHLHGQAWVKKK